MPVRPRDLVNARDVQWQTVSSSDVHSALFNESEGGDFYVRFLRSGPDAIYVYPDRDPSEWDDFRTAMSKGAWIWDNPRDEGWPHERLTTRAYRDADRARLHPDVRRFLT
ncbi:MAG: hypothetical protein V5A30_05935 [Haloarculaceae archaeon]